MSTVYLLCLAGCFTNAFATFCRFPEEEDFKRSPVDCSDINIKKGRGVYTIHPKGFDGFNVYCDMDSDNVNGGWTVIQRRLNGEVDFYRNWNEYKAGFGNINKEFWLGNDKLYMVTSQANYELLIMLSDFDNQTRYAKYSNFTIGNETSNYKLMYNQYSGNAGNTLAVHNGRPITTLDKDNDADPGHCAVIFKGAWWYNS